MNHADAAQPVGVAVANGQGDLRAVAVVAVANGQGDLRAVAVVAGSDQCQRRRRQWHASCSFFSSPPSPPFFSLDHPCPLALPKQSRTVASAQTCLRCHQLEHAMAAWVADPTSCRTSRWTLNAVFLTLCVSTTKPVPF